MVPVDGPIQVTVSRDHGGIPRPRLFSETRTCTGLERYRVYLLTCIQHHRQGQKHEEWQLLRCITVLRGIGACSKWHMVEILQTFLQLQCLRYSFPPLLQTVKSTCGQYVLRAGRHSGP
jgi:hypothetical protein